VTWTPIKSESRRLLSSSWRPRINLEQRLGLWAGQLEPGRKVHDVSTAELEAWLLTYKPQNRKNYRSALHGFFTWTVKIGAAPENPVTDVEIPEVKGERPCQLPTPSRRSGNAKSCLGTGALGYSHLDSLGCLLRPSTLRKLQS
jgi:hypothetical protein